MHYAISSSFQVFLETIQDIFPLKRIHNKLRLEYDDYVISRIWAYVDMVRTKVKLTNQMSSQRTQLSHLGPLL